MGQHGTVVRVEAQWASVPPEIGSSLRLLVPRTCAYPVPCMLEALTGSVATLRALASLSFEPGSPVDVIKEMTSIGTGKVA